MAEHTNMLDYLDWRGDLAFSSSPFCEVDNLILSMLSFVDFSPAVPADATGTPVKLPAAWEAVREKYPEGEDFGEVVPERVNALFEKAAASVRFREIYVTAYRNVIEESEVTQFSSVTFLLPDNSLFIAYRGTDDTIVGWREDFRLSFTHPVASQRLAVEYAEEMASVYSGPIRLGGHSKGGNLALYAAAFSSDAVRRRVVTAYSNDGPGYLAEIIESPEFREMQPKFVTYVPQSSVIGMLLGRNGEWQVIESVQKNGVLQHDPFTWTVRGASFLHLDGLSKDGKLHDAAFAEWLEGISPERRENFTDTVFRLFESTGAKTLSELSTDRFQKLYTMAKTYSELDRESRDNLYFFIRKLAEVSLRISRK